MTKLQKILMAAAEIETMPEACTEDEHANWALTTEHLQHLTLNEAMIATKLHEIASDYIEASQCPSA